MIRMVHLEFKELSLGLFSEAYEKFRSGGSNRPDRPDFAARHGRGGAGRPQEGRGRNGEVEEFTSPMNRGPPTVVKAST